jgi:caffeoyl-CoA O-methyltransferase
MPIYNEALEQYHRRTFAEGDPVMQTIREGISRRGLPEITVKPEEGRFLQFLSAASGGQLALEIGTLGGYSGTWIARGLRPGGKLITIEKDAERAEIAMEHFNEAGISERVELILGDANTLLSVLETRGPFNLVFIDADKGDYPTLFEWAARQLKVGGVFAAHNAFRGGSVANPGLDDISTLAVHRLNQLLAENPSFISTLYPAGDGMVVGVYTGPG